MKAAFKLRVRVFLKSAVRGKMFLDCFQLGLEKLNFLKALTGQTRLISS